MESPDGQHEFSINQDDATLVSVSDEPGPVRPTEHVSRALRYYRTNQRLSYKEISERLSALGQPIPPLGLTRIEKDDRRVDIDEVVALARVFGVPPIAFIFPIGHAAETELLPGMVVDPWRAARWFMGEAALGDEQLSAEAADIRRFRDHDRLLAEAEVARADVELERGGPKEAEAERAWRVALRDLRAIRAVIRQRGLIPPELPEFLAVVDEEQFRFVESPAAGGAALLMENVDGTDRMVRFDDGSTGRA